MQTGQRFEKVVGIYDREKRQPERRTAIAWMLSRNDSCANEPQESVGHFSDERSVGSQLSRKTSTKGKRKVNISDQFRKSLNAARNARNRKNEAVLAGGNTKVKVFFGSKIALGVDLRDIDKEVTMGLDLSSSDGGVGDGNTGRVVVVGGGGGESDGKEIFKEDGDDEMGEMHTAVTELPIYKRILEEDARAERILRHRKKNSALLDIYTGMFSSVEW